MRAPFAYLLSACFHGSLLWLIASADDIWLIDYAVRSGRSGAPGAPGGPQIECMLDSQIALPEMSPSVAVTLVEESPSEPATPSVLGEQRVMRSETAKALRRSPASHREEASPPSDRLVHSADAAPASDLDEAVASLPSTVVFEETTVVLDAVVSGATAVVRAPAPTVAVIESDHATPGGGGAGATGAQVDRPPSKLPTNPEPVYPEELRRQRIGGTVLLRVVIRVDGSLENVSLEKSSGYTALDDSALTAVKQWRFQPARRGTVATRFEALLPITFAIRSGTAMR